jgi:hypothetical protein
MSAPVANVATAADHIVTAASRHVPAPSISTLTSELAVTGVTIFTYNTMEKEIGTDATLHAVFVV